MFDFDIIAFVGKMTKKTFLKVSKSTKPFIDCPQSNMADSVYESDPSHFAASSHFDSNNLSVL